jgi:hypothetical protein
MARMGRDVADIVQAALESGGRISKADALALVSTKVEELIGIERYSELADLVVTEGGDLLSFEAKVIGIISSAREKVDLF